MKQPVFLDNTVLSNFALISRADLVLRLWETACMTKAVKAEFERGVSQRGLPTDFWAALPVVILTTAEQRVAAMLRQRLGLGERSCLAVAQQRRGLFVSDDADARKQARTFGIPVTGSIGILLLNIQQHSINLGQGNALLAEMIRQGYRSPVTSLDQLI